MSDESTEVAERRATGLVAGAAVSVVAALAFGAVAFMGGGGAIASLGGGATAGSAPVAELDSVATLFYTNWGNSTGSDSAAVTDGGKLADAGSYTGGQLVVLDWSDTISDRSATAPDAHWPTNALGTKFVNSGSALVEIEAGWTEPAINDSIGYRWFLMNLIDTTQTGAAVVNEHGLQSGVGGEGTEHAFSLEEDQNNSGMFNFELQLNALSYTDSLPNYTPLRIELLFRRTGTSTGTWSIRTYDESVSLTEPFSTNTDFSNSMAEPQSVTIANLDRLASYHFGAAGQLGTRDVGWLLVTGFMVCDNSWCGSFVPHGGG